MLRKLSLLLLFAVLLSAPVFAHGYLVKKGKEIYVGRCWECVDGESTTLIFDRYKRTDWYRLPLHAMTVEIPNTHYHTSRYREESGEGQDRPLGVSDRM